MKKQYYALIVLVSLWISIYPQSFDHQFHSELIDLQLSVVSKNLLNDRMIDSNMILIPLFDVNMVSKKLALDTLTKTYLESLKFLKDNDSISKQNNKDCFYLSKIIVYNKNTDEVFEVRGDKRFPSPIEGVNVSRKYWFSYIYNRPIYYLISKLYVNKCIDYVFVYPTYWGSEKVVVEGVFFAIKNNEIFVLSDHEECPGLYLLEDFINVFWNVMTGKP